MTQSSPTDLIYGTVPHGLVPVPEGAVQVSPLFPQSLGLETLADESVDNAVVLAPPGTAERAYVLANCQWADVAQRAASALLRDD